LKYGGQNGQIDTERYMCAHYMQRSKMNHTG